MSAAPTDPAPALRAINRVSFGRAARPATGSGPSDRAICDAVANGGVLALDRDRRVFYRRCSALRRNAAGFVVVMGRVHGRQCRVNTAFGVGLGIGKKERSPLFFNGAPAD